MIESSRLAVAFVGLLIAVVTLYVAISLAIGELHCGKQTALVRRIFVSSLVRCNARSIDQSSQGCLADYRMGQESLK